jgi:transglutaminase-like putative cysteine protease
MSGLLAHPAPAPAGAGPAFPARLRQAAATRDSLPVRLVTFAALGAYGAAHWGTLVVGAPLGRTLLVVAVATGGGAALALLGRLALPRPAVYALAVAVGVVTLGLGLMASGVPARVVLPGGWDELLDGLDRGFAGIRGVEWPYDGPEEWIRQTVLMGPPFLLAIAATVAFWPARRAAPALRIVGLVVLLILYATPVTEHGPSAPLLHGFGLLLLVAAWLWLPRVPPREGAVGLAAIAGVGVVSLPLAAALDGDRAWWDYGSWDWFGGGKAITFDWTHEYGPLDWPREGTTLLNVKADRPHYWKAEVLDTFDGFRWIRSPASDRTDAGFEVPFSSPEPKGRSWNYYEYNPRWDEQIRFTVRSLTSDLVVGAGTTYQVEGVNARPSADGTTRLYGDPIEKGDSYTVRTYAPNPTAGQMRHAPAGYARDLIEYTTIRLPNPGESATKGIGREGDAARSAAAFAREPVYVPLAGDPTSGSGARAETRLLRSPYRRMYRLAQSVTARADNSYEAVRAVERHLQANYTYSERVPTRPFPLNGFLFKERRGYCQQFSGAMALMLRMVGIPARVSAGFAPGSFNKDTAEYRVRDLDAHSWVEVWFSGIGWVPFDPTPAAAPAESQASGSLAVSAAGGAAGEVRSREGASSSERGADPRSAPSSEGGVGWLLPALVLLPLALAGAVGVFVALRTHRLRGLGPRELAEAQLAELRRALERLGWDLPGGTTLLTLERRLGRFAGPASGAYAGALRANRYERLAPVAPALRDRRALRRELTRGSLADRLRGLLVLPPGGPRV